MVQSRIKGKGFASGLARFVDGKIDVKGQKNDLYRKRYRK